MSKYSVLAYDAQGAFAFGATLQSAHEDEAVQKFNALPLGDHRAELMRGRHRVAYRDAPAPYPAKVGLDPRLRSSVAAR